jgi:Fic family protein
MKKKDLIEKPVFFLSSFFKKNQKLYYQRLSDYHEGDIQSWLDFFLDGAIEVAEDGIIAAKKIREIRDEDMEKLQMLAKRESESSMKVLKTLFSYPIVTSKKVMEVTGFSRPGSLKVIERFIDLGILEVYKENDGYDRKYIYRRYFDAFAL